jgi:hypothetical protein
MTVSEEIKKRLIGLAPTREYPYPVNAVGEEANIHNLEKICGYVDEEDGFEDYFNALLYLENDNPFDPNNAVKVEINDLKVGYLSKSAAKKYRKRLSELETPDDPIALCHASIKGGYKNEVLRLGVRLDFDIDGFTLIDVIIKEEGEPDELEEKIKAITENNSQKNKSDYEQDKIAGNEKKPFIKYIPLSSSSGLFYWLLVAPIILAIDAFILIINIIAMALQAIKQRY